MFYNEKTNFFKSKKNIQLININTNSEVKWDTINELDMRTSIVSFFCSFIPLSHIIKGNKRILMKEFYFHLQNVTFLRNSLQKRFIYGLLNEKNKNKRGMEK